LVIEPVETVPIVPRARLAVPPWKRLVPIVPVSGCCKTFEELIRAAKSPELKFFAMDVPAVVPTVFCKATRVSFSVECNAA
jgi:hypothetical protein